MKPFAFIALVFLASPASQMLRDASEFHDNHHVRALLEQEVEAIKSGNESAAEAAIHNFDNYAHPQITTQRAK